MSYWTIVLALLAAVAAILPATRAVHTIIGDAQIIFAVALVALLLRLVWEASRPEPVVTSPSEPPAPDDVPAPE
jgi:uncharacterized membrane protein YtjA (UPF0391 family)